MVSNVSTKTKWKNIKCHTADQRNWTMNVLVKYTNAVCPVRAALPRQYHEFEKNNNQKTQALSQNLSKRCPYNFHIHNPREWKKQRRICSNQNTCDTNILHRSTFIHRLCCNYTSAVFRLANGLLYFGRTETSEIKWHQIQAISQNDVRKQNKCPFANLHY